MDGGFSRARAYWFARLRCAYTISTPERNNIRADICTGLWQAMVSVSFLWASQDGEGWRVFHPRCIREGWLPLSLLLCPRFPLLAKEAVSMLQPGEKEREGKGGGGGSHRSIFREIFVDLQRHYRCDARASTGFSSGIWRRRKRAVNPLFTRACENRLEEGRLSVSYETDGFRDAS